MLETINARSQDSMHEQSFRKAVDCDKMMNKGVDAYLNKMLLVGRVDNSWRGKGADPTAPSLQLLTSCRKSRCKFAPRRECLYSTYLKNRQRHSQWVHLLPKQQKRLPMPPDVNIPSACHLRHHPTPRLQPLLQQANQQLQVQPSILNRKSAIHVTNVSSVLLFLY